MDELDRLFHLVVRTVRDQRPEYLSRPFEVGDLLGFIPYRAVREELAVDTNDDYAHVLTRLLAGERGYVFVDDLMQDDLKAELASPNPDLAAYRSYANARISLSQEDTRRSLEALGPPDAPRDAAPGAAPPRPTAAPAATQRREPLVPPVRPAPVRPVPVQRPLDTGADAPRRAPRPGCKYCGQPLPEGREVHFCPHCGQNLLVRRCAGCSAELETGWTFCVSCGRAAAP